MQLTYRPSTQKGKVTTKLANIDSGKETVAVGKILTIYTSLHEPY